MQLLMMKVKGDAIYSATGLIKKTGMLSNPVEQSLRSDFMALVTVSISVGCNLNDVLLLLVNRS